MAAPVVFAASAPLPPPYAGIYQPQGVDEAGWWREDDESERSLAASPLVIRDEKLTAYVKKVLCKTVGNDRCNSVRVYIIREPTFNASMSPNGTLRVFSGLLLRVRSEAELGGVLGHEFGHFERRHTLQHFRSARSGTDMLAWATVLASIAVAASPHSAYAIRDNYHDLQLSVYGNIYRHGRDQEREADHLGISYLNNSSLRPQAFSVVWQNFMAETEASARVRGLQKPNFKAIAFTASHPPDAERAGYLAELAAPEGAGRDEGADRYREALATWLPVFLDDQIKLNDFGGSEFIIESLAQNGWTAGLWFARGELYRTRGNQRDLVNAADFYSRATALDGSMADAFRGLGLSLMKIGQRTEGQAALKTYLKLKPDAGDAKLIGMMVPKEEVVK
ncbi:M48 family metallopeptidase [Novosphingobium terrae]|uniref:M48 family metallopeptidase n=1 Tax=Novosphingobium terrae TaxID=2726189 RepID=UPI0019812155|nr:M48 family metallopeptidase [Novosphingobium terrae]